MWAPTRAFPLQRYTRTSVYDRSNLLTSETAFVQYASGGSYWTDSTYHYSNELGLWQGGAVARVTTEEKQNGTWYQDTVTVNRYTWYDEARQSVVRREVQQDGDAALEKIDTSHYSYDANGHVLSVDIEDGRDRIATYTTNASGQVLSRSEQDALSTADPKQIYWYFDGMTMGEVGNDGPAEIGHAEELSERTRNMAPSPWRYGSERNFADFSQAYTPINSETQAQAAGSYTVQAGDSLQSVALALWGDSALWYMLAEANGLDAGSQLAAGMSLIVPNKVANFHHNSDTFRPYDPNKALGETSPTDAKPIDRTDKGGCGALGVMLVVVIAVAVAAVVGPQAVLAAQGVLAGSSAAAVTATTAVAAGTATAAQAAIVTGGAVLGSMATGAAASMISQGVGVATGLQDKFSWKGVALSALTAGLTQGIGGGPLISGAGKFVNDAVRGALINAGTQGIAVATGLQSKFDWTGVAAAAAVSGVTSAISRGVGLDPNARPVNFTQHSQSFAASLAGGIAGAGTRTLLSGGSFGDNLMSVLPDVIGNTIGNMVAFGVTTEAEQERALRRVGFERSASAFEERFGDTPEVAAYREAGLAAANDPESREAKAGLEQAARIMLEANGGDPEVAAFLNQVRPSGETISLDAITVKGSRDYLFGSMIDKAGIWVGEKGSEIAQGVGQFIEKNPGIGIALTLADGAFAVAAPVKYLGGVALDHFKEEATGYIADKMTGPKLWSVEKGQSGGSGFILAGGIALGGLGALKPPVAPVHRVRNTLRNFEMRTFVAGPNTFQLDRNGMGHILKRHHPDYWRSEPKSKQTFFDRKLTADDIADIAMKGLHQNRHNLANMSTRSSAWSFSHQDHGYVMAVRDGRVTQLYPE